MVEPRVNPQTASVEREAFSFWCEPGATGGTTVNWVRRRAPDGEAPTRRAAIERAWEFVDWGTHHVDVPFGDDRVVDAIVAVVIQVLGGDRAPGDIPGLIPAPDKPVVDDDLRLSLLTALLVVPASAGRTSVVHYSLSSALMRSVSEAVDRAIRGAEWQPPPREREAGAPATAADSLREAITRVAGTRDPTPADQFPTHRRT